MMRAGKDYLTKGDSSDFSPTAPYESDRVKYLRELLKGVGAAEQQPEEKTAEQDEQPTTAQPVNQSKPTLKLNR